MFRLALAELQDAVLMVQVYLTAYWASRHVHPAPLTRVLGQEVRCYTHVSSASL